MFTGLIEDLGLIEKIVRKGNSLRLRVSSKLDLTEAKIGDSIAINGACFTITAISSKQFEVGVSPETLKVTTFKELKEGERVNLERPLKLGDRLEGHLVLGHVEGKGVIIGREKRGDFIVLKINVPKEIGKYIIPKGSIAIDGVSMTVNQCRDTHFTVNLIPHTAKNTTLGFKKPGEIVNLETDFMGKYIEKFLTQTREGGKESLPEIKEEFLAEHGFI